ncbi:MAG: hypothetical protein K8J31_27935 [Anaerolineae bacterium]|nr:hypothetical protein [Anaerolineae bacterium]
MSERIHHSPNWMLWVLWVAASTLATLSAWGATYSTIAGLKATTLIRGLQEDQVLMPIFVLAVALLLAVLQWIVIRRYVFQARQWIGFSLGGWGAAIGMLILASRAGGVVAQISIQPEMMPYGMFAIMGFALGSTQWLFLRRDVPNAGWWIPASIVGWLLAGLVIGPSINHLAEMAVLGTAPAVVTGATLVWLLRQPPKAAVLVRKHAV